MKKVLVFFLLCWAIFISTCEDNNQSDDITGCMDTSAVNYNSDAEIHIIDSCKYECSDSTNFIFTTINSGLTWELNCTNQFFASKIVDITVIDTNNIWVCTAYPAKIIHISNNGKIWNTQYHDSSKTSFFNYIEMFDDMNGVAMGDGLVNTPLLLKTRNGGMMWEEVQTPEMAKLSTNVWHPIDFVDVDTGYYWNQGYDDSLYKTEDGGESWIATNHINEPSTVIRFFNADIGIYYSGHLIHRTLDGGNSWEGFRVTNTYVRWYNDIEFSPSDPANIWLFDDHLYFSSDTGKTWQKQRNGGAGGLPNLIILDNEGWLLQRFQLFYSESAVSGNWIALDLEVPENAHGLSAIDGNNHLVAIPGSIIVE